MASDRELKLRIRSVQSIGQITNAMKMVASSQIRNVQTRTEEIRPYADKLAKVVEELAAQIKDAGHPLMTKHDVEEGSETERLGLVIVGGDKGLCGAYNSNLNRLLMKEFDALPADPVKIVCLGGKVLRCLRRSGIEPTDIFEDWEPTLEIADKLAELIMGWYLNNEVDRVCFIYTQSGKNMLESKPVMVTVLPMGSNKEAEPEQTDSAKPDKGGSVQETSACEYIFEPDCRTALDKIIPINLRAQISAMLLQSKTSEIGSRLKAMTSATENADKLASELTLQYYRVRQNNITTEIIEIASGAEALNG